MGCDICDTSVLFQRPGTYGVCRNCGAEYGWLEVNASELTKLVNDYALLTIDADEPEERFLVRQRRLEEKRAELQDFLWANRYGIRNAALMTQRSRECAEDSERWAEAHIEDGVITIRVPTSVLPDALEQNPRDDSYYNVTITNVDGFARDVVRELNSEAEDGTTAIHEMFDRAMACAIENGSEHIDIDEKEKQ